MPIYYTYALVLGVVLACVAFFGAATGKRSLILGSMVLGAACASPITTFTRGAAGAIFPGDIVALALLFCMISGITRRMFYPSTPVWYRRFLLWIGIAAVSVVFVAPLFTLRLEYSEFAARVRSPIPGLPLSVAMAGFRLVRLVLYWVYFAFAVRLVMDAKTIRFTCKVIVVAITALAVCQIVTFLGIADMALYLPGEEYQQAHIVGHAKAVVGRLYVAGFFVCLILLYRSAGSVFYLGAMATMVTAIYCSGSRAALLGAMVGTVVFTLKARLGGKLVAGILIAFALASVTHLVALDPERAEQFLQVVRDPTRNARWIIWTWVLQYLAAHPITLITGVGFTNFNYALASQGAVGQHAHNDVLTCLTELGFVGTVVFIMYLYYLARSLLFKLGHSTGRERWEALCLSAAFAGFLVTGLFEPTFYYSPGAMGMQRIFAVLFGMYTAWWLQQTNTASVPVQLGQPRSVLLGDATR
jgi:O-antigen ligase